MTIAITQTQQAPVSVLDHWHLSSASVLRYAFYAVPLVLLCDVSDAYFGTTVLLAAKAILYLLLIGSLFLPTRQTLIFLFMLAIVGADIVQIQEEVEISESFRASIWQGGLGVLRPSWVFIVYYFGILMKRRRYWIDRPVAHAALFYSTVPFVTGWLYGAFETPDFSLEIPADAKLPLFLLATVFLARNEVRTQPAFAGELLSVFLGAALARHAVDLAHFILGTGAMWDEVQRVSVDSTKGTVVLLFLLSQFMVLRRQRYIVGGLLAIASGLLVVAFSTRGLWLSALIGVAILCFTMRAHKVLLSFAVILALIYAIICMLSFACPDNIELATKRFGSKTVAGSDNFFEDQDPTRYVQILNAWDATMSRRSLLWGSGYGAYYTESAVSFPQELKLDTAFSEHSLRSGRYYTIHHFVLKAVFKYGVVGCLILTGLWIAPAWRCFWRIRDLPYARRYDLMLCLIAFLPTSMLEISWTSKGMIVSGFAIAICMSACDSFRRSERPGKTSPTRRWPNQQLIGATPNHSHTALEIR